jgi:drug/metabolite transporter (DMT)-like permease
MRSPHVLYFHIAVFIWGFTGVLGRSIGLTTIPLVWWRLGITCITVFLLLQWFGNYLKQKLPQIFVSKQSGAQQKLTFTDVITIMIPGFFLALHWLGFYGSIKVANVSIALVCLSTSALMAALLEPLLFKKAILLREVLLGVLVIAGIVTLYYNNLHFSTGILYGVVSALLTVSASLCSKRIVHKYTPVQMLQWQSIGALIMVTIIAIIYKLSTTATIVFMPIKMDWLYLIILSWVCTIFTFILWMTSLQKLSVFTTNIILALEPVYGVVLAFLLYKEYNEVSKYFYVGFIIIMIAVLLHSYLEHKKDAHAK